MIVRRSMVDPAALRASRTFRIAWRECAARPLGEPRLDKGERPKVLYPTRSVRPQHMDPSAISPALGGAR